MRGGLWAGLMPCCSLIPLCDVVLSLGPCISVAAAFHEVIFVGGLFLAGLTALGVFFCVACCQRGGCTLDGCFLLVAVFSRCARLWRGCLSSSPGAPLVNSVVAGPGSSEAAQSSQVRLLAAGPWPVSWEAAPVVVVP